MSTDHIFTEAKTGKFTCLACGAAEAPPHMPAPITVIIDAMDHFISQHEDCKAPAAETVMSDYIICTWLKPPEDVKERLQRFAELVRADEREACAKVCDDKARETFSGQCQVWGDHFARAIRART